MMSTVVLEICRGI